MFRVLVGRSRIRALLSDLRAPRYNHQSIYILYDRTVLFSYDRD